MFGLRVCGANDFVSSIDPDDRRCSPPGSVEYVSGWDNPRMLKFSTRRAAEKHSELVGEIDGVHTHAEEIR